MIYQNSVHKKKKVYFQSLTELKVSEYICSVSLVSITNCFMSWKTRKRGYMTTWIWIFVEAKQLYNNKWSVITNYKRSDIFCAYSYHIKKINSINILAVVLATKGINVSQLFT